MVEWVRRLFAPRSLKDEEQTRIADLLHYILLATIAINIVNVILLAISAPYTVAAAFWINATIFILQFCLLILLQRGYTRLASWALCAAFWLAVTASVLNSGGLFSTSFSAYAVVILIAGLVLGGRSAGIFAFLSIAMGFYLLMQPANQKLAPAVVTPTAQHILANNTVIFATLAVLLALAARSISTALQRARSSENAVTDQNVMLQAEIAERRRAEGALRASEEAARAFQERLKILNEVTLELSNAVSFDDLCRQAIELGREKLNFDRLGLWFLEGDHTILGSFGTDETGNIRDERGIRSSSDNEQLIKQAVDDKQLRAYSTDYALYNHRREIVGHGWNVVAVLWDGGHVIGYLSVDNLLNLRPLTDSDLEILTLFGSTLGHLCRRKRAEQALYDSEEAARQFQERLKILNEINIELTKARTFDDLCRAAVELGCVRLDFDRLGLWFWSGENNIVVGSYGIDETGNVRDERGYHRQSMSDDLNIRQSQEPVTLALGEDVVLRNEIGEAVGKGWNAMATLWDGDRAIGWLAADNLLKQRPLTNIDLEILKLYGLALGNLCSRKRTAQALEASEEAARAFQERLKALYEVSLNLARIPTFDELCRAAVELGRSKLGFDRLGIWLLDSDPNFLVGSFGTDEHGNIRDEREVRFPTTDQDKQVFQAMSERASRLFLEQAPIYDEHSHVVGMGQKAMAMLSDGHMVIGTMSTDNLLQRRPITSQDLEVLVLYGSTLGYLCSRKRAEEALLKERNLLRTIIDIIPELIYVKDIESRLVLVNKASWTSTPGAQSERDLIGLTDTDFMPAEIAAQLHAAEKELFANGNPLINVEEPPRPHDGRVLHFLTTKAPLLDNQGKMIGLVGVSRDITDQKQAEQQRLELALQKERVDLLTEFIGNISHDLKTPLSVIKTSLYLLERLDDPVRQEAKIQIIKEQTLRLEKLIQDVITMSRLEHGVLPVFEMVDFNAVIHDVAAKLNPTAERKQLTVSLQLTSDLPSLLANENELWRLMANLYENALHYTPESGSVTIISRRQDNFVIVEVSDSGIGISAQDLPFIFDRFYRADPARSLERGGTGLGLAIVQRIMQLHQGKIEVESVEGGGSTFRVIFLIGDTISDLP